MAPGAGFLRGTARGDRAGARDRRGGQRLDLPAGRGRAGRSRSAPTSTPRRTGAGSTAGSGSWRRSASSGPGPAPGRSRPAPLPWWTGRTRWRRTLRAQPVRQLGGCRHVRAGRAGQRPGLPWPTRGGRARREWRRPGAGPRVPLAAGADRLLPGAPHRAGTGPGGGGSQRRGGERLRGRRASSLRGPGPSRACRHDADGRPPRRRTRRGRGRSAHREDRPRSGRRWDGRRC